jgi:hypothetical protein
VRERREVRGGEREVREVRGRREVRGGEREVREARGARERRLAHINNLDILNA